jgi:hypothetical protein
LIFEIGIFSLFSFQDLKRGKKMPRRKQPVKRRNVSRKRSAFTRKSRLILPWPFITFILLSIGVLLIGWTFQAQADDIHVTAKVSAPLPIGPAIITSPGDGAHFKEVPITVSGTCPTDTYIKLYRNNIFSGTTLCTVDGNFSLDTDLFAGANQLQAKVFNLTDDEGPQSPTITVYYDVPQQPTASPAPGTSPTTSGATSSPAAVGSTPSVAGPIPPLTIQTNFDYRGYEVGQTIETTFELKGGKPPYALNIDWGDGTNTVLSQKEQGSVNVSHRYKKAGTGTHSSYLVKITGSDSEGRSTYLQLFLVVRPSAFPKIITNTLPAGPSFKSEWLKLIWPAYFVVILMAVSFWLGEREELVVIKNRKAARRRT